VLGVNTNLRASDLTQITVGMVKDKKTGVERKENWKITLNKSAVGAIERQPKAPVLVSAWLWAPVDTIH